jgi:hypothetical protein
VRNARRGALLPLVLAVGGVLLTGTAASATVSATWSKPTDNAVYTTSAPVDFSVTLDRGRATITTPADGSTVRLELRVPGPNAGPFTVDTSTGTSDRDLKFTFDPACPNHAGACASGSAPAYNGRYTASLSGGATGSRTVTIQVPPAAPTGVSATATGQHKVKVAWAANREPDLTGYDVYTAQGGLIVANLPVGQLSYEFDLPSSGYGGEHSYVVRAHRLACANCDSAAQLDSEFSAPASVTLTEPTPEPDPDGDGGTGGGDGGTGGGDGSGGGDGGYNGGGDGSTGGGDGGNTGGSGGSTGGPGSGTDSNGYNNSNTGGDFASGSTDSPDVKAAKQKLAFGLTFKSFAPKLGAPKLPPLPKFAAPTVTIPEGTYDPMLEYGDQTVVEPERVAAGGGVTSMLVDSVTSVFEGRKLYRSIAIALLLLLAAGHLRLWLRSAPTP